MNDPSVTDGHWQAHATLPVAAGKRVSSKKIREAVEAEEAAKSAARATESLRELAADHGVSPGPRGISPGTMSARLARRRAGNRSAAKSRARNRR